MRTLWVAIIATVAVLAGATTGLLAAAGGMPVPLAILAGGGAFGGTGLLLSVARFLAEANE